MIQWDLVPPTKIWPEDSLVSYNFDLNKTI